MTDKLAKAIEEARDYRNTCKSLSINDVLQVMEGCKRALDIALIEIDNMKPPCIKSDCRNWGGPSE